MKSEILMLIFLIVNVYSNCILNFKAAKVCKFYKLHQNCMPSNLETMDKNCEVLKVTRNEKKCPYYSCYVMLFLYLPKFCIKNR